MDNDHIIHKFKIEGCFFGDKTFPGINDLFERFSRSPRTGVEFKNKYLAIARASIYRHLGGLRIHNATIIHYVFHEPSFGQIRDFMNIFSGADKIIEDALVSCKVLKDDSPKFVINTTHNFFYTDKKPFIDVHIEEIP
jgi:hypothetical protein